MLSVGITSDWLGEFFLRRLDRSREFQQGTRKLQGGQGGTRADSDAIGRDDKQVVEGIHLEMFRQVEMIHRGSRELQGGVR